jgi:DNA-damage-inducible protein J
VVYSYVGVKANSLEVTMIYIKDTNLCIRINKDLKNDFNKVCSDIGIDMSTAIMLFVNKTVDEKRIPFEISSKK